MKNSILKTTLSISLVLATLAGATSVYAKNKLDDLNLTDAQIEQLKEYRESKKEARVAQKEAMQAADKAALSEFLTDEQVEAVMAKADKGNKGQNKKDMKSKRKNGGNNERGVLNHAEQLELTENQVVQIQSIIDSNKPVKDENSQRPTKEEKQATREAVKAEILTVLTDAQIEELEALQAEKKEAKGKRMSK